MKYLGKITDNKDLVTKEYVDNAVAGGGGGVTGVKGNSESTYRTGNVNITKANIGLGNVADGAEVNQNAFSNVKVGSTTVAADTKTDTLELVAGSNITLTPDATNDKVTIAATDTTYESKTAASGGTEVSLVTTGEKYTWNNKQNALTNPVTGTGTSGYLAKFNGTTTVTNGPQIGSDTTKYLRNDGSWSVPMPNTGTVKKAYASAKTVNNNSNTNLTSISLEAGTWVVTAGVRFPSNASGLRRMNIATTSGSANADVQTPAASGGSTQLAYTVILSPTATTTYYLNCYQNSGTNMSLVAGGGENGLNFIRAVRIL